jgi:hypothetical protein
LIGRIWTGGNVRRRPVLMGRGLDGSFSIPARWLVAVQLSRPRRGRSRSLSVALARGIHLFPFRTEKLSLSAPMVLGPSGPGRVGRRRLISSRPRPPRSVGGVSRCQRPCRDGSGVRHGCGRGSTRPGRRRRACPSGRRCGWRAGAAASADLPAPVRLLFGLVRNMCSDPRNDPGQKGRPASDLARGVHSRACCTSASWSPRTGRSG